MGNPGQTLLRPPGNGQFSARQANSHVGQWMKPREKRRNHANLRGILFPILSVKRYRFTWTDFGAGKRAILRLRSWTATFVRVMVLAHFLGFALSPRTHYVRLRPVSVANWSAGFSG